VRYCHWKGRFHAQRALSGEGDLDLLVDRRDAGRFESVLALLGFKRAVDPLRPRTPSVSHYYGLDEMTGALLHVHVYYRLVTGENLLDNYSLPLEELLLRNARLEDGMPVAQPGAALLVVVVRAMLKRASITEELVFGGDTESVQDKLRALLSEGSEAEASRLVEQWLPGLSPELFQQCLEALRGKTSWRRRFRLARKLRRRLAGYRRFPWAVEAGLRTWVIIKRGLWRLLQGSGGRKDLDASGAVIAFVGLDASGKSTLVREARGWLGKVFRVSAHHLGKPSSAWATLLPNLARRLLSWARPSLHMSARQDGKVGSGGGLLYRLRMVLLAWDRRALAIKLHRRAANGWIVLCDRYPSAQVGAIDGAILPVGEDGGLKGYLARLENRLYRQAPPPDIVIRVVAPAEVAVERNRLRREPGKEKSDTYVAYNHRHVRLPSFQGAHTLELSTNRSRDETVQDLRRILWQLL
jgi:thymidylate kinase